MKRRPVILAILASLLLPIGPSGIATASASMPLDPCKPPCDGCNNIAFTICKEVVWPCGATICNYMP